MPSFTEAFLSQQNYYFLMKQANIPPSFHISNRKSLFQTCTLRVQNNKVSTYIGTYIDAKSNVFVKPNEQNRACSSYAMVRKGRMKSNNLMEKRLSILRKLRIFVVQLYFLRCNFGWTHSALDAFILPLFHFSA